MRKSTATKPRVCGCGHEESRHALIDVSGNDARGPGDAIMKHRGPCSHGCRCAGFHKRRRHQATTITDPGGLLSGAPVVIGGGELPVVHPRAMRTDPMARVCCAFDELRDAVVEALGPADVGGPALGEFLEAIAPRPIFAGLTVDHPRRPRRVNVPPMTSASGLPKGELAILTAIAQHSNGCDRPQLTVLTGYKASTRNAYLQRLIERRFVFDEGESFLVTNEGLAALGSSFKKLPTGDKLRELMLETLPEGEGLILDVVCRNFPNAVVRDALSVSTGYKPSTRNAYIQRLEARKLVELPTRDSVVASPHLFTKKAKRAS